MIKKSGLFLALFNHKQGFSKVASGKKCLPPPALCYTLFYNDITPLPHEGEGRGEG